jgi:predicted translin family RNA/ssDNA-binding protein
MMPTKITYYAMVDDLSSREEPAGVLRRVEHNDGERDEAFTRSLEWKRSSSLYSYERGNSDVEFFEISEDEASRIVERIRRTVTGQS